MTQEPIKPRGMFVNEDENNSKKPVIFAGSIFYKHIHESLKLAQASMLTRNFEQWTVILLDLNSKMTPFMNTDKVKVNVGKDEKEIILSDKIEMDLQSCLNKIMNNGTRNDRQTTHYLLRTLLAIQKEMFTASSNLFIGLTDKEDNDYERDQEDGG